MSRPRSTSPPYNAELVTSRLKDGSRVQYGLHTGVVRHLSPYRGIDGVHRCMVEFDLYGTKWCWTVPVEELKNV